MTNITINSKNNTIELTKAFEKKASQYGTMEYNNLQAVRRDYPTYSVVVLRSSSKKGAKTLNDYLKKITFKQMEAFIKSHDENGEVMNEFNRRMGRTDDGVIAYTYPEIKKWFIEQYEDVLRKMIMKDTHKDAVA